MKKLIDNKIANGELPKNFKDQFKTGVFANLKDLQQNVNSASVSTNTDNNGNKQQTQQNSGNTNENENNNENNIDSSYRVTQYIIKAPNIVNFFVHHAIYG